jgi:hypothetical protein
MSLKQAIMTAYKKEERDAHMKCICGLKYRLDYHALLSNLAHSGRFGRQDAKAMGIVDGHDSIKRGEAYYIQVLQDVCDGLFVGYGWQTSLTIGKYSWSVGMSSSDIVDPNIGYNYRAGKINILSLMRRGKRNLGPNVDLKYSTGQLRMNKREREALLRRIGELY